MVAFYLEVIASLLKTRCFDVSEWQAGRVWGCKQGKGRVGFALRSVQLSDEGQFEASSACDCRHCDLLCIRVVWPLIPRDPIILFAQVGKQFLMGLLENSSLLCNTILAITSLSAAVVVNTFVGCMVSKSFYVLIFL